MPRIVAGRLGGRVVKVPKGQTRPTSQRVREALFALLDARLGGFDQLAVVDLYAGSGALGFEAASRGATQVTLVEVAGAGIGQLRRNVAALGLDQTCHIIKARVEVVVAKELPGAPFGLVLIDPPYDLASSDLDGVLQSLATGPNLASGAVVVVERSIRTAGPAWPGVWQDWGRRTYGETALYLAKAA